MKKILCTFLILSGLALTLSTLSAAEKQRSFMTYRETQDLRLSSPGAFKSGLFGFDNPALLMYNNTENQLMLVTSDNNDNQFKFNRWGLFGQTENSSWAAFTQKRGGKRITDWRYSLGFGSRAFALGLSYGFVGGDKSAFGRSNTLGWGFLIRPSEYVSLSGSQNYALKGEDAESVVDLGIRPLGNELITVFGDFAMFHDQKLKDGTWGLGAIAEPLKGLRISGTYRDDKSVNLGVNIAARYFGLGAVSNIDKDGNEGYRSYGITVGGPDRSIFDGIVGKPHWTTLKLAGDIKYQRYKWFDNSITLRDLLTRIDNASKDKTVCGMIIDARQFSAGISMAWEIRDRMNEFRKAGKKIVIFTENPGIGQYFFASVADKIVIDPLGQISTSGLSLAQSYYKKMLDKVGIGFEELRLFKYKSAYESFARDTMSEGNREQYQKLLNDFNTTAQSEIAASRSMSREKLQTIIDSQIFYNAKSAKNLGLVDTVGRWDDRKDIVNKLYPELKTGFAEARPLYSSYREIEPFDDKWGYDESGIALIYLNGNCAMDGGIDARRTRKYVENAAKNPNIKAIVLRVDSPGGDPMASDYIAEIVRRYKGKKPFIVSQGSMAASGGYWLSMDADEIVTTPFTLTGSIGVIGAWIYDKGLSQKLGIGTEVIKTNKYSDLGRAFSLPLIGAGLPLRNLNQDERSQFDSSISTMYFDFVDRVAAGRKMGHEEVHNVAQGRVWTGASAKDIKLVDEIGGLTKAIAEAKIKAGIPADKQLSIYEYPEAKMLNLSELFGFGSKMELKDSDIQEILFMMKHNGSVMTMMPTDALQLAKPMK